MNALITREHNGAAFTFREDGYFNMTKAAQHFGKRLTNFWALDEAREYMCIIVDDLFPNSWNHSHLNADARKAMYWYSVGSIRLMTHKEEAAIRALLVEASRGSGGGSWAHPKLAVFFARWLKPEFGYWCDKVIADILYGRSVVVPVEPVIEPEPVAAARLESPPTREEVAEMISLALAPIKEAQASLTAAPPPVVKRPAPAQHEMITIREWLRKIGAGSAGWSTAKQIGYDVATYCREHGLPLIRGTKGVSPNQYPLVAVTAVFNAKAYPLLPRP